MPERSALEGDAVGQEDGSLKRISYFDGVGLCELLRIAADGHVIAKPDAERKIESLDVLKRGDFRGLAFMAKYIIAGARALGQLEIRA